MSHRIGNPNVVQQAFQRSKERESLIRKDVQKANEGPFDKRVYPPKWAFEPITAEEYERQKTEYESVSTTDAEIINYANVNKPQS